MKFRPKTLMRKLFIASVAVATLISVLDACASSRKCDGRKAVKTPMGKM